MSGPPIPWTPQEQAMRAQIKAILFATWDAHGEPPQINARGASEAIAICHALRQAQQ
jgi:hypothetical protein